MMDCFWTVSVLILFISACALHYVEHDLSTVYSVYTFVYAVPTEQTFVRYNDGLCLSLYKVYFCLLFIFLLIKI